MSDLHRFKERCSKQSEWQSLNPRVHEIPLCECYYCYVEDLERRYAIAVAVLTSMAAFGDKSAQQRLDTYGRYTAFDEPGAVQTSREALAKIGTVPGGEL